MRKLVGGRALLLALLCWAALPLARAAEVGQEGVSAGAGNLGALMLSYPEMEVKGKREKPNEVRLEGKTKANLKYPSGLLLTVTVDGAKVVFAFSGTLDGVKSGKFTQMLPFDLKDGGKWAADNNASGAFPAEKPAKPQFFSGHTKTLSIINIDNTSFNMTLPPHSFVQLQDNREWGWSIFCAIYFIPFNKDNPNFTFTFAKDATQAQRVIIMDKFGQNARKDFPDKVKSEEELIADIKDQEAYFASFKPLPLDEFGGLAGTGEKLGLKKTGFFRVEKKTLAGKEVWVMVDPAGNAFFQIGICGMGPSDDYTYVEGRESVYEWLPEKTGKFGEAWHKQSWWSDKAVSFYIANVVRKYGSYDPDANMERMVNRVRKAGFNSMGAFYGKTAKTDEMKVPYCPFLPKPAALEGIRGVFDPFNPKNIEEIKTSFAKRVAPLADDPLVIGWFLENEQAFEDLPRGLPKLNEKQTCKVKLIEKMEAKYKTIEAFNAAWGTKEASFADAAKHGLPVTTKAAYEDMHAFTGEFLEAYYKLIRETYDQHDKNHMLIGNRWQPGTANNEQLCTIAGKYLDVISINYYTYAIDDAFVNRIYQWTGGKPQLWSEFHYCSSKDSGNPARVDVGTQDMRGLAYRNYVEGGAALGYVVGVQWFVLIDQSLTGRWFSKYNGENYGVGLFSVVDRPYRPMMNEMAKTNNDAVYKVWLEGAKPYVLDDARFAKAAGGKAATRQLTAPRMVGENKIDGQLEGWPNIPPENIAGSRIVNGSDAAGTEANFKLSYDDKFLYVFVQVRDETPLHNPGSDGGLWNGDGVELFIGHESLDKGGQLLFSDRQILLGADKSGGKVWVVNADKQPKIDLSVVPQPDGKGYILEAGIPWDVVGTKPEIGKEFLFDVAIDDGAGAGRLRQLMWNGIQQNSKERGRWGRFTLAR